MIVKTGIHKDTAQLGLLIAVLGHQVVVLVFLFLHYGDRLILLHALHLIFILFYLAFNYVLVVGSKLRNFLLFLGMLFFAALGFWGFYEVIQLFKNEFFIPFVPALLFFCLYSVLVTLLLKKLQAKLPLYFLKKPYSSLLINYLISCMILLLLQVAVYFEFEALVLIMGAFAYTFILLDQITRAFRIYIQ